MSKHVAGTKGARVANRTEVFNVVTPPATDTWQPVSHKLLIDTVATQAEARGLKIVGEQHFLGKDGSRYFGRMKVEPSTPNRQIATPTDYGFFVGLRNSLDKSYAGSIGFGTNVFVCANGMFSAEFIMNRKHTPEILTDLPRLTGEIMGRFGGHRANIQHRFDIYKHTEVSDRVAHDLIINAAESGATNYRQVPTIVKQWKTPDHPEFGEHKNAWRLLNAFTEAAKLGSESDLWDRSLILQGMMDRHCGYEAPDPEVLTSQTPEAVSILN
jgi:hypothetical protein